MLPIEKWDGFASLLAIALELLSLGQSTLAPYLGDIDCPQLRWAACNKITAQKPPWSMEQFARRVLRRLDEQLLKDQSGCGPSFEFSRTLPVLASTPTSY